MQVKIYSCEEWGARPPRKKPTVVGRPTMNIFHHTFGHVRQLDSDSGESLAEAFQYARDIQDFHMDSRGWNDTGQNFLVTRGGHTLEGRHGSINAIRQGKMVVSAHCVGYNDQPGTEHEHRTEPNMTRAQHEATVLLHAWICRCCSIRPHNIFGHSEFNPTSCPAELKQEIASVRADVANILITFNPYDDIPQEIYRWFLWIDRGRRPEERSLAKVRTKVPFSWWAKYQIHKHGNPV